MESRGAAPSASHPDSTPTGRRFSFGDRRKTYLTFPDTLYSRYKVLSVLSRPLFHLLHSPAGKNGSSHSSRKHSLHSTHENCNRTPDLPHPERPPNPRSRAACLIFCPRILTPPFWVTLFSCCLIGQMIFFQQMKNQTQSHADHTGQNHSCQFYISDL